MTVTLSPEQEQAIAKAIEAGEFRSIDDFVDNAVRRLTTAPPEVLDAGQSALRWDGDWLVHTGRLEPGRDWENVVNDAREDRIAELLKSLTP